MKTKTRTIAAVTITSVVVLTSLGGCVYRERTVPAVTVPAASPPTVIVPGPQPQRVVTYPEGSYELRGDVTTGYYWVWIPRGVTIGSVPPPPPLPR